MAGLSRSSDSTIRLPIPLRSSWIRNGRNIGFRKGPNLPRLWQAFFVKRRSSKDNSPHLGSKDSLGPKVLRDTAVYKSKNGGGYEGAHRRYRQGPRGQA